MSIIEYKMDMWLYKSLIVSFLVGFAYSGNSQNKIKWTTWDTVTDKYQKSDKKFMVYICYGGCKWCKQMEDSTFADNGIARFINVNFLPLRLNASSKNKITIDDKVYALKQHGNHEFNELAIELLNGNMTFPSIVFLDEHFKKISSYNRFIEPHNFEMLLAYYAGNFYKNTIWKVFTRKYNRGKYFQVLPEIQD